MKVCTPFSCQFSSTMISHCVAKCDQLCALCVYDNLPYSHCSLCYLLESMCYHLDTRHSLSELFKSLVFCYLIIRACSWLLVAPFLLHLALFIGAVFLSPVKMNREPGEALSCSSSGFSSSGTVARSRRPKEPCQTRPSQQCC